MSKAALRPKTFRYGEHADQFLRLWKPSRLRTDPTALPVEVPDAVVVIVHGGFWRGRWTVDNAGHGSLGPDLARRGMVAVEVEYRRCGRDVCAWPAANHDLLRALHFLPTLTERDAACRVDCSRIVLLGHSAGATMVLWAAAKLAVSPALSAGLQVRFVVALAPLTDLAEAARLGLSDTGDAVQKYMGGTPDMIPNAYEEASPICFVSKLTSIPLLLVWGTCDKDIPRDFPKKLYDEILRLNPQASVSFIEAEGEDHYDIVRADAKSWKSVAARIVRASL